MHTVKLCKKPNNPCFWLGLYAYIHYLDGTHRTALERFVTYN